MREVYTWCIYYHYISVNENLTCVGKRIAALICTNELKNDIVINFATCISSDEENYFVYILLFNQIEALAYPHN